MPLEQYKRYTIGIARGQIKPKKSDPKIWFDTIETCMQVLSTHNLNLLKLIDEKKPESVEELARISGRQKGNLSRTLKKIRAPSHRGADPKPAQEKTGCPGNAV